MPIVHDKTFFFVDYQGSRQAIARVHTSTVPTALQRQGIFSEAVEGLLPEILDKLERDVSTGDIPSVLATSLSYELPGRGPVLRGWQLAAILTLQSGMPLAVTQNTNFNAFAGSGTQRPNRLRDPNLPNGQRTTSRYFYPVLLYGCFCCRAAIHDRQQFA